MPDSSNIFAKKGATLLSAREVAKRLSCAPDYVSKLCREGKLEGERVDNAWFVRESSIDAFEKARTEARMLRSQELALERQKEQDHYRKNNPVPSHFFESMGRKSAALALGGAFLFASLVYAGQVATPVRAPLAFGNAQTAAVLASVSSPFFNNPSVSSLPGASDANS